MAAGYTLPLNPETPTYRNLLKRLASRLSMAEASRSSQLEKWQKAEERMLAYLPETALDTKRRLKREAGRPDYTTIQIPYSYAIVMTAHTYLASVFLSRTPIHQFSGNDGESEMNVASVEALMNYQVVQGGMLGPYYVWLHDALKYGAGIIGNYWDREIVRFSSIQEGVLTTREARGYTGSRVYNISPMNFLHDPRVSLGNFQKGEFCVVKQAIPWNQLVRREAQGYYVNLKRMKGSGWAAPAMGEGSSQLERPEDFKLHADEGRPDHPATAYVYEMYVDLIPKEWGISTSTYPEKWCFTVTQDKELILGASPLGAAHGQFPFAVAEVEIEAYGRYSRGFPEIMQSVQQTVDWLVNSHFFNVRAALNNQFVIDPSRITMKSTEANGPGVMFRLRPEAYGTPVDSAIKQFPVVDVTRNHFGEIGNMFSIGERVLGVTDQLMGMLPQQDRVTATAARQSAGFGVNRLKTITEYISATAFAPHGQQLLQAAQQNYDAQLKMRIVGDVARFASPRFIQVSPDDIVGSYDFIPVDGTMPVDRFAQATMWKELMVQAYQIPTIAQGIDWLKLMGYVAQLLGVKNFMQFRLQAVPDAALAASAGAGNVVPMNPEPPGVSGSPPNAATMAGMSALMGAAA